MSCMAGVKRTLIGSLGAKSCDFLIIAVIIAKQSPRTILLKKDSTERSVWNFTIRDSPADYMNVSAWGSVAFINNLAQCFHVGDVVDIIKAKVSMARGGEQDGKFLPAVTSPLQLTLNENFTEMCLHDQNDCSTFLSLLHLPTKPPGDYINLSDIHSNSSALCKQHVNLLVAVRSIGPIRHIKTKTGKDLECREVTVMDQTHPGLTIQIWEAEEAYRADNWQARNTILFFADILLDWSAYKKEMTGTVTARTIITEDPTINDVQELRRYARTAPVQAVAILDHLANNIPDPGSINNVMSCNAVYQKATAGETAESFTAVVYGIIEHLDLDGCIKLVVRKCSHCHLSVDEVVGMCINMECPSSSEVELSSTDKVFDIRITLMDHTGCIENCRLTAAAARNALQCSEEEFENLSLDEKTILKWKFLLKRCASRLVVMPVSRERLSPLYSVVSTEKVNLTEYAARVPMY